MSQAREYRRELRQVEAQQRQLQRTQAKAEKSLEKQIHRLRCQIAGSRRATLVLMGKLEERQAILRGRLR